MPYIGTQPNDVKKNTGLYTPSEILQLTKDGHWGGSLELIETESISGTPSTIDFKNLANNPYDVYLVQMSNVTFTAQTEIRFKFSNDNGVTFESAGYQYASLRMLSSGSFNENRNSNASYIGTDVYSKPSTSNLGGYFYLYNLLDSSKYSFLNQQLTSILSGNFRTSFGGGSYNTAETINAFQIIAGSSTFTTGVAKLYGVKQT